MTHKININKSGDFFLDNVNDFSYLYMPLFNEFGMMSSISPDLHGDAKLDQFHFALAPVTSEDLIQSMPTRNIYFLVNDNLWSTSGKTPYQKLHPEHVLLQGGLLYQKVNRSNELFSVTTTSFVPSEDINAEFHQVIFKNISKQALSVKPTVGFPLYGRSADNIRDHRHVTSLLNRASVIKDGIINEPSLKFDERGHRQNGALYGVFSTSSHHDRVKSYQPLTQDFIGEGQDAFYPIMPRISQPSVYHIGDTVEGYDVTAGLGYDTVTIQPNEELTIMVGLFITSDMDSMDKQVRKYLDIKKFDNLLNQTKSFWQDQLKSIDYSIGNEALTGWNKWVSLQPTMRRIYGCSFLPHHDYGRGGRGWRDLWQDSLSLIFKEPNRVREDIFGHFAGVRIDGSNATIVGVNRGEFHADRNKIVRVWSDHGAWPLLTVDRYINRTGDIDFLFEKQTYFKDKFAFYTHQFDPEYLESSGNFLKTNTNEIYHGTILEHLLLENVIPFFNVGNHGNIRIEDADWNDGMDMAKEAGETVAFTAMYTGNLLKLINILNYIQSTYHTKTIELLEESMILFDRITQSIDYQNPVSKRKLLEQYFNLVKHNVSGEKVRVSITDIIRDLTEKYQHFFQHLNQFEWMDQTDSLGWYNGYYNNQGIRLESPDIDFSKMTLTGQTFVLMSHLANQSRIEKIVNAVKKHLTDPLIKIPRLNTNFGENKMNMGRFMGFAYGHKENGSMFSHMAVMYAYSLLDNNFVSEGREIIDAIYTYMSDVDRSHILPGIPEYIDQKGRGMYHYLTGSASWLLLIYIEQIFGIKGEFGDIIIEPKLIAKDFSGGSVKIKTMINHQLCEIIYTNPDMLDYGQYDIDSVNDKAVKTSKYIITKNSVTKPMIIKIQLGVK